MTNPKTELISAMVEINKKFNILTDLTERITVRAGETSITHTLEVHLSPIVCRNAGMDSNRLVSSNINYILEQLTKLIDHIKEEKSG